MSLTQKDLGKYSLRSLYNNALTGRFGVPCEGFEKEVSEELQRSHENKPNGALVPFALFGDIEKRDLSVNVAGQGGDFVQTSVGSLIPLLRNKMVCARLGVRTLGNLQGNLTLPRQTGAATASSLGESALLSSSTQANNEVALSPHRLSVQTTYSRQLLLQSTPDLEQYLRQDLMQVLAIAMDGFILTGQGANSQPSGIANTTGIGSVTFGGAADYSHIVSFETALATSNADAGRMAYVSSPTVKAKWKTIAQALTGATTVSSKALWESYDWGDNHGDGLVNGYRACATNQVANNSVFFGNFQDATFGQWGSGIDLIVNPFSLDTNAQVRITANVFVDVALLHAQSFAMSTDSGSQ